MRVKQLKNRYTCEDLDYIVLMYMIKRGNEDFLCLAGVQGS